MPYVPFEGICLTDTFQMYESEDLVDQLLEENSERRKRQKSLDIRVIIGNPPYSAGQSSANDNNANIAYPELDERIRSTYAARTKATSVISLYDSYIRSIRWASDRIGNQGVIGFVTNGGFLGASTANGLRKCLAEEFSSIHVFYLGGNSRISGEGAKKEGGNIFNVRVGIAISILVKNPQAAEHGNIKFYNVGDYLGRDEKLERITNFFSISGILNWKTLTPDEHGDWLNQRDDSFSEYMALGDKKDKAAVTLFENYSNGVKTQRDAWAYNSSLDNLSSNIKRLIESYNQELDRFEIAHSGKSVQERENKADTFLDFSPTRTSWTRALKNDLIKGRGLKFQPTAFFQSLYRPFTKQWLYFDRKLNEMVYQMPRIFPKSEVSNFIIAVPASPALGAFSALISNTIVDLNLAPGMGGYQCFPLYLYEEASKPKEADLFSDTTVETGLVRRDAITDEGLVHFQEAYPNQTISKKDLFYYVYGILHSEDYRSRFANNLSKELPRIPRVKTYEDFTAFSQAGRQLAELHLNYETVDKYPVTFTGKLQHNGNDFVGAADEDFYVTKMKHPKKKDEETGKSVNDLSKIIYNTKITLSDIPLEAYDYVVNGKSALAWVMERQGVSTHKASGIVNDANDWAIETMDNSRYPLELLQRVITVSLETMKIVRGLPELDI